MDNNTVADKSFAFAIRIVKLYRYLCDDKKECILSKQLLRSGTSIGANIQKESQSILEDCTELIKMLTAIVKTTADNI